MAYGGNATAVAAARRLGATAGSRAATPEDHAEYRRVFDETFEPLVSQLFFRRRVLFLSNNQSFFFVDVLCVVFSSTNRSIVRRNYT